MYVTECPLSGNFTLGSGKLLMALYVEDFDDGIVLFDDSAVNDGLHRYSGGLLEKYEKMVQ